ncbi:MAG: hypothetical protein AB2L18_06325 [Anaerolineaceae bacterium]
MTKRYHRKPDKDRFSKNPIASSDIVFSSTETSPEPIIRQDNKSFLNFQPTTSETPTGEEKFQYQASISGLLLGIIKGSLKLKPPHFILFSSIGYLSIIMQVFLQDNESGRLDTKEGFRWLLTKIQYSFYVLLFVILIILLYWLISHYLSNKKKMINK